MKTLRLTLPHALDDEKDYIEKVRLADPPKNRTLLLRLGYVGYPHVAVEAGDLVEIHGNLWVVEDIFPPWGDEDQDVRNTVARVRAVVQPSKAGGKVGEAF